MSDELSTAACAFALLCAGAYAKLYLIKDAQHNSSLRGRDYYKEVMTTRSAARFFEVCRMSYASFLKFVNLLVDHGGLEGSRNIHTGEMTMMFMNSLTGASLAKQAERWQHSKSTCSECNAKVRKAILNCKKMLYVKASEHDEVHSKFLERKFAPFYRHGSWKPIGALDGSHVVAHVNSELQEVFRNRKKWISQNVLGVCNFDCLFSYALLGWEGSAHDGKVVNDAFEKGLPRYDGQYYFGDAGYGLSKWILTPYRGVRYHLRQWIHGEQQPQNPKELFNLRHAQVRNVIERIYGAVKKAFPVLSNMPTGYSIEEQVDIVECCFLVYNFRRIYKEFEDPDSFLEFNCWSEQDEYYIPEEDECDAPGDDVEQHESAAVNKGLLNKWRDDIADELWAAYMDELKIRGIPHNSLA